MDVEKMMAETMRRHMPAIKTQAQFDAVMIALEATKEMMSGILEQDAAKEASAFAALQAAMDVARKATELQEKLQEVPEEAISDVAAPFRGFSPEEEELRRHSQFDEVTAQQRLLGDVEGIGTMDQLTAWYASTKPDRDQIKTQSLRNELMDAIRAKRNSLAAQ